MNGKIIKYRPEWFGAYGLDIEKNFLSVPICECGCGEKPSLLLNNTEDLFEFMFGMLMEYECNHCAIFAHTYDNSMYVALKVENKDNEPVLFFRTEGTDMEFFKKWDEELDLHCYGLMIEFQKGKWKIIEI